MMADKEKKVAQDSKVDKATTEESKAAEKVAKAAKGSKSDKPNFFARAGKSIKRFGKDFKPENLYTLRNNENYYHHANDI